MSKSTILTGLRANNDLTIGNYFGALLPIVDMATKHAGEYQINMFVPDLHSFTTPIDHSLLLKQTKHNLKVFVAAGLPIDHDNVFVYRQSYIPAHSELAWILSCFTGFGEMSRMTQFKDKTGKASNDRVSVGLFNYPILMAADILLYNTDYVPVGDDQTQHLEFTRNIAERMNMQHGKLFTVPAEVKKQHNFFGKDQGLRVRDLQDPTKKMSKSDDLGKGVIFLSDDPQVAAKKVMSATTDSFGEIKFDFNERPGISNLLQILALLSDKPQQEVNAQWEGKTSYGEFKKAVADAVEGFLTTFQERLTKVDEHALEAKLVASETAMKVIADATLLRVQKAVGLRS